MKMKTKIINIILILISNVVLFSSNWPIKEFTKEQSITGVIREFRIPHGSLDNHFHSGIDMRSTTGTAV